MSFETSCVEESAIVRSDASQFPVPTHQKNDLNRIVPRGVYLKCIPSVITTNDRHRGADVSDRVEDDERYISSNQRL